ncbi:MAG: methyltransferase [Cyanosarcina radialis HA8281-LM2]|jgi:ubiquinone/menaquinone biosynthesis C-methylase UbiE|nr:methyltransferase [Cyanosarcina radialis HA8281-LM2]
MVDMNRVTNSAESATPANELFNHQWQIYQKVLKHNYMGHQEIYQIWREFIDRFYQQPFKLLDLGCGDACFTSQFLRDSNIALYQGIDLSAAALEIAKTNLARIPGQQVLIQGDLFELVPQLAGQHFDLVFASFVLHHLSLEQKDYTIGQIFHLLEPGGVFLLIDAVHRADESREAYIQRYLNNVRQDWLELTPEDISEVDRHMSNYDFPETQETWRSMAQKHGFIKSECLYADPLETTELWCFYR